VVSKELRELPLGKGEIRRTTSAKNSPKIAILAFGTLLYPALEVAEVFDATVANMRFIKPLDVDLVCELAKSHDLIVTLEEGAIGGGAGSACLEALSVAGIEVPSLILGLPDRFVDHGDHALLMKECGLDVDGITKAIALKLGINPKKQAA
jgi:1-deoxy-D-xylulose-5-phosphate synthase